MTFDVVVVIVYLGIVAGLGLSLAGRSRTASGFVAANGRLSSWVVGLSLFGTFLSSNTFLGVPGKAFAEDWNSFVFSLSLPLAAWVAVTWFVPFHRKSTSVSAFHHLEQRFGTWARLYALVCYLLTQIARVATILFGVSLALGALLGLSPVPVILGAGVLVTLYTVVGGIEAVIWTDAVQSVVLSVGVVIVLVALVSGIPGGLDTVWDVAGDDHKTSLGSFGFDLGGSTFWVVLLYGFVINLNNFGIDQNYVQRYHAATDERAARRSVWMAAWLYLPISFLFFVVGTVLYVYYTSQPVLLEQLRNEVATLRVMAPESVGLGDLGDRAFPSFIATGLPPGVGGIILAALLAAAMSSVDTSLNSSATVVNEDFLERFGGGLRERWSSLLRLRVGTVVSGVLGTLAALLMINIGSLLDAWWTLSGVFAGGVLGLFLLGITSRAGVKAAVCGVTVGVVVIAWMTLSPSLPEGAAVPRSGFHTNMIVVFGTSTVLCIGLLAAGLLGWRSGVGPGGSGTE